MSISQFIRIESYGRSSPKKAKAGFCQNVLDVISEAIRDPGSIPHVKNPKEPITLYGDISGLATRCEDWASSMTDSKGRALRKDALCLVAGVVSAPSGFEDWAAFRDASVAWLKGKYGKSLDCVLEHVDEDQPHIHFYVVPQPGMRFESVHEGRAASDAVKGDKMRASKEAAYSAAMTGFQDTFHREVASLFDFDRLGPAAPRVSRAEAMKRKEVRKTLEEKLLLDVEKAIKQGSESGREKGFKEGFEEGRQSFGAKSLYAKLWLFVSSLKKKNAELSEQLSSYKKETEKIAKIKDNFVSLKSKFNLALKEIKCLRAKNNLMEMKLADLQVSLINREKEKESLLHAKDKVLHLEAVLDVYKREEAERAEKDKRLNMPKIHNKESFNALDR